MIGRIGVIVDARLGVDRGGRAQVGVRCATGRFEVIDWRTSPSNGDAPPGTRLRVREWKILRGDVVGESIGDMVVRVDRHDALRATYSAREEITACVCGRRGTFVVRHWGVCAEHGIERGGGRIVPGSGTRDLAGICGVVDVTGDATGPHTLVLTYQLMNASVL